MPRAKPQSKARSGATAPWWLSDGDEACPHCGHFYVLELEFRCSDCDGPGCPHCKVVHAEGRHVCPDCAETPADG